MDEKFRKHIDDLKAREKNASGGEKTALHMKIVRLGEERDRALQEDMKRIREAGFIQLVEPCDLVYQWCCTVRARSLCTSLRFEKPVALAMKSRAEAKRLSANKAALKAKKKEVSDMVAKVADSMATKKPLWAKGRSRKFTRFQGQHETPLTLIAKDNPRLNFPDFQPP